MKKYETKDHLTAFLYELMRDHVPLGRVEQIVAGDEDADESGGVTYVLSNAHLARYAAELSKRLKR